MNSLVSIALLGQVAESPSAAGVTPVWSFFIALLSTCGFFGILVFALASRSRNRRFDRLHEQRMKALELGRPMPDDSAVSPLLKSAVGIGIAVPAIVFGSALAFSVIIREDNWYGFSRTHMVWTAAGTVGLAAVICSTILALASSRHAKSSARHADAAYRPSPGVKDGFHDPDALDVASRRG